MDTLGLLYCIFDNDPKLVKGLINELTSLKLVRHPGKGIYLYDIITCLLNLTSTQIRVQMYYF